MKKQNQDENAIGKVEIVFADHDHNNQVLAITRLEGEYGTTINYRVSLALQDFIRQGYQLYKDEYSTETGRKFSADNYGQRYFVLLNHQQRKIEFNQLQDPDQPNGPLQGAIYRDKQGNRYQLTKDATLAIVAHFQNHEREDLTWIITAPQVFQRPIVIDQVTHETLKVGDWQGSYRFASQLVKVIPGFHANQKQTPEVNVTADQPDIATVVTYIANGKVVPTDVGGHPLAPGEPFTTDKTDATRTIVQKLPLVPGYHPTIQAPIVPAKPSEDMPVIYAPGLPTQPMGTIHVLYMDQDQNNAELASVSQSISGEYGQTINYSSKQVLQDLSKRGFDLVWDGFTSQAGTTFSQENDGQTYVVTVKHALKTTFDADKVPGKPELLRGASQTIVYQFTDGKRPTTRNVTNQQVTFKRPAYLDRITHELVKIGKWTGEVKFDVIKTPVVPGYHANLRQAGGQTLTADQPTLTTTVTYTPNGRLIPVDQDDRPLPESQPFPYPTDPEDPTQVIKNLAVPAIEDYLPVETTVKINNPTNDTKVHYVPVK